MHVAGDFGGGAVAFGIGLAASIAGAAAFAAEDSLAGADL